MGSRSRQAWKPDARGYYSRQLGWKRTETGVIGQHKFILGTDLREAQRREAKLCELWENYTASRPDDERPLWPDALLEIAKAVARGVAEMPVARRPDEYQFSYADRIRRMQREHPVVCFVPTDRFAFEVGQEALQMFDAIPGCPGAELISAKATDPEAIAAWDKVQTLLNQIGLGVESHKLQLDARRRIAKPLASAANQVTRPASLPVPTPTRTVERQTRNKSSSESATLHQALKAYQRYLEKEYHRPELGQLSPWGKTQVKQIGTLIHHHPNMLLSRLDGGAVDELFGYWRRRPCRRNTKITMAAKSASHYISALSRFLSWLHRHTEFVWRKPEDFAEIDTRVRVLPADHAKKKLDQVDTFSLAELQLLMRYGQPFDRLLLLLALNCGFGRAEVASLLIGEVYLRRPHGPRHLELIGHVPSPDDSFIKRVRRKSGVYGEHILFPMTVQGIEWALERRRQFPDFGDDARLILNENGVALDRPTKDGNANQIIPNHFARLIRRIEDGGHTLRNLSFNKLRKTASQLIRNHADGEVMGIFDCHGKPVRSDSLSDVYSNRPFGKVFKAIRAVEAYLAPIFKEAGPNPFAPRA